MEFLSAYLVSLPSSPCHMLPSIELSALSLGSGSANIFLCNDGNIWNKQACDKVLRLRGGVMWVGGGKTFNRCPPSLFLALLSFPPPSLPPPSRILFLWPFLLSVPCSQLCWSHLLMLLCRTHDPSASPEDVEDTFAPLRSRSVEHCCDVPKGFVDEVRPLMQVC